MDRQKFALHKSDSAPFILLLLINAFIYVPSALYTPFLNAYYKMNGLSATRIGILSTISPVCFILIQHQELLFFMGMAGYAVLFILLAFLPKSENQRPPIETAKASRKVFSISELFTSNEVIFVLLFAFIFQIGASFLYAFLNVYIT